MTATPTSTSTTAAIGALLTATLFWAGNYVVGGAAVSAIPPLDLVALRWGIAVVPLLALAQLVERPDWRHVWHRSGCGSRAAVSRPGHHRVPGTARHRDGT